MACHERNNVAMWSSLRLLLDQNNDRDAEDYFWLVSFEEMHDIRRHCTGLKFPRLVGNADLMAIYPF
jgi:hypothetical protein